MSQTGRTIYFALSPETTSGTYEAPLGVEFLPNATGSDFSQKTETVTLDTALGNNWKPQNIRTSKIFSEGKFNTPLGINSIGTILMGLLGSAPTTASVSGQYEHAYDWTNSNTHQTFTIVKSTPELGYLSHVNGMMDTFDLTIDMNGPYILCDMGFKANEYDDTETPVTPAFDGDEYFFTPDQVSLRVADTYADLATASNLTCVKNFTFSMKKNTVQEGGISSTGICTNNNLAGEISGTMTINLEGSTKYKEALTNTQKAMLLKFTIPSTTSYIAIWLHAIVWTDPEIPDDLDKITELKRTFTAIPADTGIVITAKVRNDVVAYPRT